MRDFARRFIRARSGVTAVEYALIAALAAIVMIPSITLLVPKLEQVFSAAAHNKPVD